mmetsp:Transcript_35851/g.112561  ORF Transcript_35851/g.112561 Transcript_35851/m.112561 type:complete len:243 (-) Transcript_35851:1745-2473(-)
MPWMPRPTPVRSRRFSVLFSRSEAENACMPAHRFAAVTLPTSKTPAVRVFTSSGSSSGSCVMGLSAMSSSSMVLLRRNSAASGSSAPAVKPQFATLSVRSVAFSLSAFARCPAPRSPMALMLRSSAVSVALGPMACARRLVPEDMYVFERSSRLRRAKCSDPEMTRATAKARSLPFAVCEMRRVSSVSLKSRMEFRKARISEKPMAGLKLSSSSRRYELNFITSARRRPVPWPSSLPAARKM